jgi:outer membrane protein assembly factor BamB
MATLSIGNCSFSASTVSADEMSTSFELRPGVVIAPAAGRLYMMNPQGGIDAIELATGNLLWTTKAAAKPLAVFDDRLAAQADLTHGSGSLPIVLLNAKSGRAESTISIPTPDGVTPSVDDQMSSSSSVSARVEPDGLLVWWELKRTDVSPLPHVAHIHTDSGGALINLQNYQTTALASEQVEARRRAKMSAAMRPRLNKGEALYFAPQLVDGYFVSVKPGPAGAGQHAVLKRWSAGSGEPLPDVELGPGYIDSSASADESLLLVISKASTSGADYLWSFYAIASGERVAEVRLPQSGQSFFVSHSILIYEAAPANRKAGGSWVYEPLGLCALNLKTGTEIWRRALRDTSYNGPYPPHA